MTLDLTEDEHALLLELVSIGWRRGAADPAALLAVREAPARVRLSLGRKLYGDEIWDLAVATEMAELPTAGRA